MHARIHTTAKYARAEVRFHICLDWSKPTIGIGTTSTPVMTAMISLVVVSSSSFRAVAAALAGAVLNSNLAHHNQS